MVFVCSLNVLLFVCLCVFSEAVHENLPRNLTLYNVDVINHQSYLTITYNNNFQAKISSSSTAKATVCSTAPSSHVCLGNTSTLCANVEKQGEMNKVKRNFDVSKIKKELLAEIDMNDVVPFLFLIVFLKGICGAFPFASKDGLSAFGPDKAFVMLGKNKLSFVSPFSQVYWTTTVPSTEGEGMIGGEGDR